MRITLLTGEYPPQPGGVGDYTHCLARALAARGHQLSVLTIREQVLWNLPLASVPDAALPPRGWPVDRLDWGWRCWPAVIAALDELRPDWLHLQYQTGAYAMRAGVNLLPWRLRALPGRPRIAVTFHDLLQPYLFPKAGPLRLWVNQRLAADADAVIATNPADLRGLRQLAGPERTPPQLIPIGSNIAVAPPPGYQRKSWRAALGVSPAELLVAYFGLLSPSKGADQLVAALATLNLPWRLLLIGGAATAPQDQAYAAALQHQIASLGLTAYVITTGHVPDSTVSAHLLAADCVALPFRDGASFRRGSLLAALAHGCPVITTPPSDSAAAALLSEAALLTPDGEPTALAAALRRLAATPELRLRLADAGPSLASNFSWERIAAQHEALYASGYLAMQRA